MALTDKERVYGAVLAFVAMGASIFIAVDGWGPIGAGLTVLMAISSLTRRRVACAVLSFVIGLGPWWNGFIIFGAIYIVFAFLLVRAGRQLTDDQRGARR